MEAAKHMSEEDAVEELKSMIEMISRMLVDHPDEITVQTARGAGFVAFEVLCSNSDTGSLLGRRGVYADSIRELLKAAARVRNVRAQIQFVARDAEGIGPR